MNDEAREVLESVVRQITETGEWTLDKELLKIIKHHCKRSNVNVELTYDLMIAQLNKKQSQIRYSCLQLCEELFKRSQLFRKLLTDDLPMVIQLIVGVRDHILPPPVPVATKLRQYAIALLKTWYQHYGEHLRPLGIAYDYLEHNGYLENEPRSLQAIHTHDREKSNKEARIKAIQERRYEQIKTDMAEHLDLVQESIKNMETCFEILIPKNTSVDASLDFDALMRGDMEPGSSSKKGEEYREAIMSHGLGSNRYSITIDMSEENPVADQVQESEENKVVYEQLREAYKVLETKQAKQVNDWINSLVRMEHVDKVEKEGFIKQLIQAKNDITEVIRKVKLLGIEIPPDRRHSSAQDDDEEDEFLDELFEDVELPDVSASTSASSATNTLASSKLPPSHRIFPLSYEPGMTEDVTYSGGQIQQQMMALEANKGNGQSSNHDTKGKGKQKVEDSREDLLKRAPVVEWGEDLYYWDKKNVQFNTSGIEFSHRFMGTGEGTKEMPDHLLEDLRKRAIYYKASTPEKIKACRYPLHNGSLCPRRDLVTCPFHGKIIPRDELGRPSATPEPSTTTSSSSSLSASAATAAKTSTSTTTGNHGPSGTTAAADLWQEIEGEVMQQVGKERIIPGQRNKRQKKEKQKSALIDVRKKVDTPYSRLEKKIDSRETRKMVDDALEYERSMKSRDRKASTWR